MPGWLAAGGGLLMLLIQLGCGRRTEAGPGAAFDKALEQARQASVNAAEATECALTAAATPAVDRKAVISKLDGAEVATRAAARAVADAVGLNRNCRKHWDATCDYRVGSVEVMLGSTKDARERTCNH